MIAYSTDSVASWQTLNPPPDLQGYQGYAGYEMLTWHPYEDLPRMSLEDRYKSFVGRLAYARARRDRMSISA